MLTRGRGEERRQDVDKREMRREENLIPIDEDIFNPLSLCSIAGHAHGMETRGRGDNLDDMMMVVAPHLCIVQCLD